MLATRGQRDPVGVDGGGQLGQDAFGGLLDRARVLHVLDQGGELVPAQPGRGVVGPQRLGDPRGDFFQQEIADRVPPGVVDDLEIVQVDEEHADDRAVPRAAGQRVLEPVGEEHPVGQAGQRVVEDLVGEVAFEAAALGHVPHRDDQAGHRVLGPQVPAGPSPGSVRLPASPAPGNPAPAPGPSHCVRQPAGPRVARGRPGARCRPAGRRPGHRRAPTGPTGWHTGSGPPRRRSR